MKTDNDKYASFIQFVKFGIVGISNTFISYFIYYAVLFINENLYLAGNILGFIISVINACYWNRRVFKKTEESFFMQLMKSYAAYGFSVVLSTGLLYAEVEFFCIGKAVAPIIVLLITVPLNFLLNKLWTFK